MGQNKTFERTGDVILYTLPASALASSLFFKDKKGFKQFSKGFIINQAVTFGLKIFIDKERPNGENNNSFPSAHTSTTFQSAAFLQKRYGWKYGAPALALATFTGVSRINAKKHDTVDVITGALIGCMSSYIFTNKHSKDVTKELTFSSFNDGFLVGIHFKF